MTVALAHPLAESYTCPKCGAESFNRNDIERLYCGRCHVFAQDLRDEPVTDFAHLTSTKLTRRDCFSLAALTVLDSPGDDEARVVHGWARDSFNVDRFVLHAWAEFPGMGTYEDGSQARIVVVVDYSQLNPTARMIPRDMAYEAMQVRNTKHFTREECMRLAQLHGNDGPWPESPPDPPEDAP